MSKLMLHPLPLGGWRETRDTIRDYTQLLSAIRYGVLHSGRVDHLRSLQIEQTGFSTGPLPIPDSQETGSVRLDLCTHRVVVERGPYERRLLLSAHSPQRLRDEIVEALNKRGIQPELDNARFDDGTPRLYDPEAAERFIQTFNAVASIFQKSIASLACSPSPLRFFTQNFELASGCDELFDCGISTGNDQIPAPHIFVKILSNADESMLNSLQAPARLYRAEWRGLLLFYAELLDHPHPDRLLLQILTNTFEKLSG